MPNFSPPTSQLDGLDVMLEPTEWDVAQRLGSLDDGWTVHVKPRIGLERPDFLVTHDRFGVCALVVRNWTTATHRVDPSGFIEGRDPAGGWTRVPHPTFEAARARAAIHDRHYALPGDDGGEPSVVRAVVVLPRCSTEHARALLAKPVAPPDERDIPVWGADDLHRSIEMIVHGDSCRVPTAPSMNRLLSDLVDAGRQTPTETPTVLTPFAAEIADNPSATPVRRARGPAGSGKSFALASRAAVLADQGRQVLALTFSITSSSRLRELVNLHCARLGADATLVSCTNFHSFSEQVVADAAQVGIEAMHFPRKRFADSIVAMAMHVLSAGHEHRVDAVLVDEGQDVAAAWWGLLRDRVVAPGGEMLLMTDQRQNIYNRGVWDDEDECVRAGFTEPWIELTGSQRLPADVRELAGHFSAAHLFGEELKNPFEPQGQPPIDIDRPAPSFGRWTNLNLPTGLGQEIGREVVRLLRAHPDLSPGEITFLCDYHHDGEDAVAEIESAGYAVHHLFSRDPDASRRHKRYRLWPSSGAVTGCTIHSFKGWGTRALVMGIGRETGSRRTAYVSMTRVAADAAGRPSFLSVLNSDPRVADFAGVFDSTLCQSRDPVVSWAPPAAARVG